MMGREWPMHVKGTALVASESESVYVPHGRRRPTYHCWIPSSSGYSKKNTIMYIEWEQGAKIEAASRLLQYWIVSKITITEGLYE